MNPLHRHGNFSSSSIWRLTTNGRAKGSLGAPALSYIKEKQREIKLKRSITNNALTRPIIWGKILELYVFREKLPMKYKDGNNSGRLVHPEISRWTGVPDTICAEEVVGDTKCPTSLVKFCDAVEEMELGVEAFREANKEHYWQLISNAILSGCKKAERIVYVPYASELEKIRDFVASLDLYSLPEDLNEFRVKWIYDEIEDYLNNGIEPSFAFLPNDSEYKDLNTFVFDVPQEDIDFLTERVKMATKLLIK